MSSVFLSFGPKSGFLLGHCLNSLVECNDMPQTWYSEGHNGLLPNAVFFDNAKSVRLYEDFYFEEKAKEAVKSKNVMKLDLPEGSPVSIPKYKPTPFIEYIKNGGKTILPLDQPRPDFMLENCEISWCDIVNFDLPRKSFVEIPGTDIEPMNTYMSGFEKASENDMYYEYTDPIRKSMETCDRVTSFICMSDRNDGFGGFFSKLSDFMTEEAPKAVRFVYSMDEDITSNEVAVNASLSLASCLDFAHIHTVLLSPPVLPDVINPKKYHSDNVYSKSALLSMALTSSIYPILNGKATARQYLDTIAPTGVLKFASLSASFPSFDPIVPFSFPTEGRILTKLVSVSGVGPDSIFSAIQSQKPDSPYFYNGFGQEMPLFVGLTCPHMFKDEYITSDGQKPTTKPPNLSQEDYDRFVKFGVIKKKDGLPSDKVRVLSSIAEYTTSSSLVTPLKNSVEFVRNAHVFCKDISPEDSGKMSEIILNLIDALQAEDDQ